MMTSMHASICSMECVEMWAMPACWNRSAPAARMREPVVSWKPTGTFSS
jgi:hypothetical protein